MKTWKLTFAILASVVLAPQAMACFTVYNTANQVVYSGLEPPIDMSYQIHQRLPEVFPGGHMVFGNEPECPRIDLRTARRGFDTGYVAVSSRQPSRQARADRN
ncbi:MAG: hypothetical protein EOO28_27195 [Comamonadaceae bacterium]|nr:MAG: hypothetical protein EOO28_27195 [Comamonadaceae bacterium]